MGEQLDLIADGATRRGTCDRCEETGDLQEVGVEVVILAPQKQNATPAEHAARDVLVRAAIRNGATRRERWCKRCRAEARLKGSAWAA